MKDHSTGDVEAATNDADGGQAGARLAQTRVLAPRRGAARGRVEGVSDTLDAAAAQRSCKKWPTYSSST